MDIWGDTKQRKCLIFFLSDLTSILFLLFLGITNFDLLGKFSEVKWLGNFYLVLLYNAIFAVAASLCIFKNFTDRVRKEIVRRWVFLTIFFLLPKLLNYCQLTTSSGEKVRAWSGNLWRLSTIICAHI